MTFLAAAVGVFNNSSGDFISMSALMHFSTSFVLPLRINETMRASLPATVSNIATSGSVVDEGSSEGYFINSRLKSGTYQSATQPIAAIQMSFLLSVLTISYAIRVVGMYASLFFILGLKYLTLALSNGV